MTDTNNDITVTATACWRSWGSRTSRVVKFDAVPFLRDAHPMTLAALIGFDWDPLMVEMAISGHCKEMNPALADLHAYAVQQWERGSAGSIDETIDADAAAAWVRENRPKFTALLDDHELFFGLRAQMSNKRSSEITDDDMPEAGAAPQP